MFMKEKLNLEQRILELVQHSNYQPLKPKQIAKKLDLLDEIREVKRCIKRLIKQGRLQYGPKHLVLHSDSSAKPRKSGRSKSSTKENEIIGRFRRAAAGFGFVTPLESTATDRSEDIFIPHVKILDAADRDIVKVKLGRRQGEKQSGRIIDVVQRHTYRFVGTYKESNGLGIVNVDGGVFDTGILVGDAGAKNGRPGDKVVIEMAHFPSAHQPGEGVIVEILGDRGQPGVDTLSIIRQYDLPDSFPEQVLASARQQADAFDEESLENRTDFTSETVVTIDPKTARDFDDAISLKKLDNGHWQLGVHIADVSHFVPQGTPLDDEAYHRATSVYLPDRVIPMLPEIISNNLASLQPHRVRYCMTAIIEFAEDGMPIHTELHRGAIKSAHRFNYEEIDDYLENDQPWKKKLSPEVFALVRDMHTLAMQLRRRRMDGGAINLVLPEVKIDLDDDGKVAGAHTVDHTESHQVIEEFMLAANEAVARYLDDRDLNYLRRIHPIPDERKLQQLTEFVRALGIECDSLQDRHELKRVVEASEGRPEVHAIHFAVLRSLQKAIYSPEPVGHYALNSKHYCHFTSPIRRYPDLVIHRMIGDLIDGKTPNSDFKHLSIVGKHCSDQEKRAADAERDLIKLKLLNFLHDRIGKKMDAIITGVEAFGVFAQGIEIPAEGLVPEELLPEDSYYFDRATRTLTGHKAGNVFRLGDTITVEVAMVDPDQRLLEFGFVGRKRKTRSNANRTSDTGSRGRGNQQKSRGRLPAKTRGGAGKSSSDQQSNSSKRSRTRKADSKSDQSKSSSGRPERKSKSSGQKASGKQRKKTKSKRQTGPAKSNKKKSTRKPKAQRKSSSKSKSKQASAKSKSGRKKRK